MFGSYGVICVLRVGTGCECWQGPLQAQNVSLCTARDGHCEGAGQVGTSLGTGVNEGWRGGCGRAAVCTATAASSTQVQHF